MAGRLEENTTQLFETVLPSALVEGNKDGRWDSHRCDPYAGESESEMESPFGKPPEETERNQHTKTFE